MDIDLRGSDNERRRWADLLASTQVNYNILIARRGQELLEVKVRTHFVVLLFSMFVVFSISQLNFCLFP